VDEWLVRLQQGSSVPSFVGTYVVSASNGAMASARIWHLCQGDVQLERAMRCPARRARASGATTRSACCCPTPTCCA
jgi:negative regulator of sigma E activity